MTKSLKKLDLNKETLLPLTVVAAVSVDPTGGGTMPLVVASIATVSMVACTWFQRRLGV